MWPMTKGDWKLPGSNRTGDSAGAHGLGGAESDGQDDEGQTPLWKLGTSGIRIEY